MLLVGCNSNKNIHVLDNDLKNIQTRKFEATKKELFPAVKNLFQDFGYIVSTSDYESGFISASTPISRVGYGIFPYHNFHATAQIEETDFKQTKLRLALVNVKSKGLQTIKEKELIKEKKFYIQLFDQLKKNSIN